VSNLSDSSLTPDNPQPANGLSIFNFEENQVRSQLDANGNPLFVATDVCLVCELDNVSHAVSRLDDDEKGIINRDTPGGVQEMLCVNESGLYSLILTSRKPAAKRFKKLTRYDNWRGVVREVYELFGSGEYGYTVRMADGVWRYVPRSYLIVA
jgi:hypothetical protein